MLFVPNIAVVQSAKHSIVKLLRKPFTFDVLGLFGRVLWLNEVSWPWRSSNPVSMVDERDEPYQLGSSESEVVFTDNGTSDWVHALIPGQKGADWIKDDIRKFTLPG